MSNQETITATERFSIDGAEDVINDREYEGWRVRQIVVLPLAPHLLVVFEREVTL